MNTINVENCKTLLIGRRGENEVTTVAFDFTEWASEFGSGVVDLYVKRFGDNSAYPVVLTIDGTIATWTVTATDTNVAGYGKAEYVYRVDGKIAKSAVFPFFVADDIGQPASEPPDPYESWLEQLTALGAETEANAQAAEQSAENAAESAEDAAQSAASADGYAGQAETAAGLAQAAQTASEAARDAAQTAQASAEASATAASGSAASAAGSASDASSSASAAGVSATTASTAAGQAEAAKTAAQAAQSAAEDAAEDAQEAAQQAHVEYEQLSGEVDDLSDEVSQQKSAIDDLTALVDRKAGMLVDSASGSIASFVPDSTIPDLLGVSVAIEPVQDLHGFDSPWPGGGNVNLWDTTPLEGAGYNVNIGTVLDFHDGGEIAVDGNRVTYAVGVWGARNFKTRPLSAGAYTIHIDLSEISNPRVSMYVVDHQNAVTDKYTTTSASIITRTMNVPDGYFILVYVGSSIAQTLSFVDYQIEAGTAFTAWLPYENLCPIYGWDAVEVVADGENLVDEEAIFGTLQGWTSSDGIYTGEARFIHVAYQNGIPGLKFKTRTPYTVSVKYLGTISGIGLAMRYIYTDGTSDLVYCNSTTLADYQLTSSANKTIEKLILSYGSNFVISISNFQLVEGSTATEYKPYAGNRYTIQLGNTVYGAKLSISEDGSVNALVNRAMVDLGTLTWNMYQTQFYAQLVDAKSPNYNEMPNAICSLFRPIPFASLSTSDNAFAINNAQSRVNIVASAYSTPAEFKTAMSGVQLVYELATPIEIQLDPVTISAIANQTNNVWANTGDVSVEFAADLKAYIDSKIAALAAQIVNS